MIVEALLLAGIEPGRYEFMGAPLRMVGAEASPIRALIHR